jgi:cytochrome oxidase Cu insertion factor (SCO1/SenC/PrrC family)
LAACGRAAPTPSPYEGTALEGAAPGFELTDQDGAALTLDDLRGRVVVVAFLDSRCVEVCPRTAEDLRRVYRALGERAGQVAFVGINTNAQANAVADVRAATEAWGLTEIAGWRFLTGDAHALQTVWAAYHIGVVPGSGTEAPVDHTPAVYILDAAGAWRWYVSMSDDGSTTYPEFRPAAELLQDRIEGLLGGG